MNSVTESQRNPKLRKAALGVATVLAVALAVAVLLGIYEESEALASPIAPQSSTRGVQSATAPQDTLVVATSPDYWPMEYISGTEIIGHDIDLMNFIGAEMSVTIVYTSVPWGAIFQGLIDGEYDAVISTVSVTPERDEVMDFTLPYVTFAGDDNVAVVVQQGNDLLRQQMNEALWALRADGTLATIVANIAADVPESEATLPDWPDIPPDSESTLVYTDTNQCSTAIQIPPGAVTETVLLVYSAANTATASSGSAFAGHAFSLEAYQDGLLAPGFTFSTPVTVTIHYTETDLAGMDETSLSLNYWDDDTNEWRDAATTCIPHSVYDRRPDENWLAVPICHLSRFALFGEHRIYLPLVLRN